MKYRDKFWAGLGLALLWNLSFARVQSGSPLTNMDVLDVGPWRMERRPIRLPFKKAIDACSRQGEGTVTIPAGRFVTETIQMKNRVTLVLAENAVLLGSTNIEDYQDLDPFETGSDGKENGDTPCSWAGTSRTSDWPGRAWSMVEGRS